jgi:AcrR family transcriptional regulator
MNIDVKGHRPYRSERRRRQANDTRREILVAARGLFGQAGYGATSVADIAEAAGVAVQTVYAVFESKRGVFFALLDVIDDEGEVAENQARIRVAVTGEEVIQAAAHLTRRLNEHAGDLLAVGRMAAGIEPDVAAVVAAGMARHVAGADRVARRLGTLGLRSTISLEEASAMVGTLTSPESYFSLTETYGWSFDAAEAWIAQTLCSLLLPPSIDPDTSSRHEG